MDEINTDLLGKILIWLIPGISAITLHEYAHGWMAARLGDTTARDAGRLSLNPLRHVDPVGTFLLPGLMLLFHMPFIFGWAKPVPVDFQSLRGGRKGTFLVSIAGVLANFVMLLFWLALFAGLSVGMDAAQVSDTDPVMTMFAEVALVGVVVNLVLIIFNLIPLPPLDGGRAVGALLPEKIAKPYMRLQRYGIFVLLLLIATGAFAHAFEPLLDFILSSLGIM